MQTLNIMLRTLTRPQPLIIRHQVTMSPPRTTLNQRTMNQNHITSQNHITNPWHPTIPQQTPTTRHLHIMSQNHIIPPQRDTTSLSQPMDPHPLMGMVPPTPINLRDL